MSKQSGSSQPLPIPPLALLILCMLLASFCSWLIPSLKIELPLALPVAVLLSALGIAFSLAGVSSFRAAATSVNPIHLAATQQLVTQGVYRISRNPMYVGFLLILCGWCWLSVKP